MKRIAKNIWVCAIFTFFVSCLISNGWAKEPWEGKITYTKTPPGVEGPKLAYDSYVAVALQPRVYGCRNKTIVSNSADRLRKHIL